MEYLRQFNTSEAYSAAKEGDNFFLPCVSLIKDGMNVVYDPYVEHGPQIEFVDLGLPSGTLWSKSLLGATNGDTKESWYGDYYAWGEVKSKSEYSWLTYKYANGSGNKLIKYCNNAEYGNDGYTDGLTQLVPEDDAATVTNSTWRIPTKAELEELTALPNQWVKNYDPNKTEHTKDDGGIQGLNGRVFTGKNGNTLFIPAAGYRSGSGIYNASTYCSMWASSLNTETPSSAPVLFFGSANIIMSSDVRCGGHSVCPVR